MQALDEVPDVEPLGIVAQSVVAHDPPSPTALGSTEVKAENLAPQGSAPRGSGSAPAIVVLHYFLFAVRTPWHPPCSLSL